MKMHLLTKTNGTSSEFGIYASKKKAEMSTDNHTISTINEIEVTPKECIIAYLAEDVMATYGVPESLYSTVIDLLEEMSFTTLCKGTYDILSFLDDNFIGETLFENALEKLGGKTDDHSYEIIHDYLHMEFVGNECSNLDDFDLTFFGNKTERNAHDEWVNAMLLICSGNEGIISSVRENIDKELGVGEKIFMKERIDEWAEKFSIPRNHKELSTRLKDEVYYSVMDYILNYEFHFGFSDSLYWNMVNQYDEMHYILFSVIRHKGFDVVFNEYSDIFEIREIPQKEGVWFICLKGDPYEVANRIDCMRDQYKELFN